ncbi:formyltetrahydrofolate deformylase [Cohaesibacter celericrescens]|uniref:Formyltetrahydrofolate deformylase n=1 Tax=Cohaesibacter celericrescens TaxID=2067669 RepID=A0A2N5XV51_9HYPH|nr:formyltetrahydrofolate deformylase [Cohaesibacter celericrescens]PLW78337.1 formyltetrahydrofolate deformylase [Cohaesibacter celericrescens]
MTMLLKMTCPDQPGVVADLSARLLTFRCNILESNQYFQPAPKSRRDDGLGSFFMRVLLATPEGTDMTALRASIDAFAEKFSADISLRSADDLVPTILMVSKFDHCLQDILYRVQKGSLPLNIVAVVSNHADSRNNAERLGIPFYLWSVDKDNKVEQEAKLNELVERTGAELIVLARYMQILSDDFSSKHFGKIINIHHSFLPAFKGAKPYHRAWERGVKMIGATAHYVTPDLDEGPIIEQGTERVSHTDDPDELIRLGRDIEARVLSRALRLHSEGRVFIDGNRTVVFSR